MNEQNKIPIPPAQLWIGPHGHIKTKAELFLQNHFCTHNACNICTTCRLIRKHQYHGAIWLYPEKWYTLDQIALIFGTIAFSLAPNQHCFFVIQKADFLTAACSNSLLKSIEEPPPGYHFILLAERKELILPTIRSRCIIKTYVSEIEEHQKNQVLDFFKQSTTHNPTEFTRVLETVKPNEQDTIELLDKLFIYWMKTAKQATSDNNTRAYHEAIHIISVLGQAMQKPPMPGSSRIFWKNLFLSFT